MNPLKRRKLYRAGLRAASKELPTKQEPAVPTVTETAPVEAAPAKRRARWSGVSTGKENS